MRVLKWLAIAGLGILAGPLIFELSRILGGAYGLLLYTGPAIFGACCGLLLRWWNWAAATVYAVTAATSVTAFVAGDWTAIPAEEIWIAMFASILGLYACESTIRSSMKPISVDDE